MTSARRVNERADDNAKTLAAHPGTFPRVRRLGPHAVLGLGALLVLAAEWAYRRPGSVAWLLASRRGRDALVHAGSFVAVVALAYVPFLAWNADHVLAAYTRQSGRSITPESMWYLLLRPFDLARVRTHLSFAAGAPEWADALAVVVQVALLLALVLCAVFVRGRLRAAVALAVLAPAVVLLTNRIFSPQLVIVLFASWAVAAALVAGSRREQLAVGV